MAIRKRHLDLFNDLLTLFEFNLNIPAFENGSPLFHAVESGSVEIVERLVNHRNFRIVEEDIAKALALAQKLEYGAIVEFLEEVAPREGTLSSASIDTAYPHPVEHELEVRRDLLLAMLECLWLTNLMNIEFKPMLDMVESMFARLYASAEIPAALEDPSSRPFGYDYLKLTFEDYQSWFSRISQELLKMSYKTFFTNDLLAKVQKQQMWRQRQATHSLKGTESLRTHPINTMPMANSGEQEMPSKSQFREHATVTSVLPAGGDASSSTDVSRVPIGVPSLNSAASPQPKPCKRRRIQENDGCDGEKESVASDRRGIAEEKECERHDKQEARSDFFKAIIDLVKDDLESIKGISK
jgi:hypothetical protein